MEMRNITLRFGGVKAITDISFDIREGEIRAIIGPNGAGKSSMLNVISGFYVPQEGEVWFRGHKRPQMKPYRGRASGHCPHLPEHRPVRRHERAGQHHDRPADHDEIHAAGSGDLVGQGRARGRANTAPRSKRSSTFWKSSTSAKPRWAACPMA
jgi:ABC-type phosphonate transport system ATPase subunit